MAKTKISEFSATPGNNTDIDGINIAEGCAPSGINDAIRELMSQLKDFQAGTAGDSFNGPVGTTTAAAGAFTTLSASSTVSGTGFSTYLASPPAIGGTTAAAGSFTTLSASGNVTLSGGTANGVAYLNGSKVLTTGSGLVFDGSNLGLGVTPSAWSGTNTRSFDISLWTSIANGNAFGSALTFNGFYNGSAWVYKQNNTAAKYEQDGAHRWYTAPSGTAGNAISFTQAMTLDASGRLGIGETSPGFRVSVRGTAGSTGHTECLINVGTDADVYSSQAQIRLSGKYGDAGYAYIAGLRPTGGTATDNSLVFGTVATERARIDSSGNLLVGTTTSSGRLTVSGSGTTSATNNIRVANSSGTVLIQGRDDGYLLLPSTFNNTTASAANMNVDSSGFIQRSTSARKYKQDIRDLESIDVGLIKPVRYKSACANDDQTKDHFGVIADDVAEAGIEELVTRNSDGEVEGFQYERLTVVLLKSIQELKAEFDAYKATHP